MKKAAIYGAGNIGRGFIGQLFYQSGYHTVFVDVNEDVIKAMNQLGTYRIETVSKASCNTIEVNHISAINGNDNEEVDALLSEINLMAISVGVHVLPYIVDPLIKGFRQRWRNNNKTALNILICENLMYASKYLRRLIMEKLTGKEQKLFNQTVGLVDTTIGRMVPKLASNDSDNILDIAVEPYRHLPADKNAFIDYIPNVVGMEACEPFEIQIVKKLYIHNMGHAICAYLGATKDIELISDAMNDSSIEKVVKEAMTASATAISLKYGTSLDELILHVDDLVERFKNPYLNDPVKRVANDPLRKLKKDDRLIGAALLCKETGVNASPIIEGIATALKYRDPSDNKWTDVQTKLEDKILLSTLADITELDPWDNLISSIASSYRLIEQVNMTLG